MNNYKLSENDLYLLKQSSNWATRSYSKIKSIFDRKYGESTRDILNKTVDVENKLQNCWDYFVTSKDKTSNDISAINEFVEIQSIMNSSGYVISKYILPMLKADGFFKDEEKSTDDNTNNDDNLGINLEKDLTKDQEVEKDNNTKIKSKRPPARKKDRNVDEKNNNTKNVSDYISYLTKKYEELRSFNLENETDEDKLLKNNLTEQIFELLGKAKDMVPEEFIQYTDILSLKIKDFEKHMATKIGEVLPPAISELYFNLIKNANNIESIVAYKLLAESAYGSIKTPIKEKLLALKQYLPFGDNQYDIFSFRKTCITSVKHLIKLNEKFLDSIQKAIDTKNQEMKWLIIINGFNNFAEEYNKSIELFVQFYDLLKRKATLDKIKKSKKNKSKNLQNTSLSDFQDYTWSDFPAFSQNKFKKINLISIKNENK